MAMATRKVRAPARRPHRSTTQRSDADKASGNGTGEYLGKQHPALEMSVPTVDTDVGKDVSRLRWL
jgi:hypothetical protein